MNSLLQLSKTNQQKAWEVIRETRIMDIWEAIGAEVHVVGSLKTGLMMKHLDIDLHVYSSPLNLADSFGAMAKLAENPSVKKIECTNLLHTEEACIEWHVRYLHNDNEPWKMDIIHILKGSRYDGYFEKMAERISSVLTDEMKQTILQLKYETPETEQIMGAEYYQAVIRDGVKSYAGLQEWRKQHPVTGIIEWMP